MYGNLTNHLVEFDNISSAGILLSFTPTVFDKVNEHLVKSPHYIDISRTKFAHFCFQKYFKRKFHHLNHIFNFQLPPVTEDTILCHTVGII